MTKRLLHVHIRGWTATFRMPLLYSGTGLTSPVPPYSTLIGMIGCMAGRDLLPQDVGKIGYIFNSESKAIDLETTKRLSMNEKGERAERCGTGSNTGGHLYERRPSGCRARYGSR